MNAALIEVEQPSLERKQEYLNLHNVLYATDFSSACENAWSYALAIAREYGSKLFIAHVIAPTMFATVPRELLPLAQRRATSHAEHQMQHLRRLHGGTGELDCDLLLRQGNIADVLLGLARQHEADLMVLGTRGHRYLDRLLLGSVAEKVFRLASCPVLVVPERAGSSDTIPVHRILLATDLAEESIQACEYATSLAQHFGAGLVLLHVLRNGVIKSAESLRRDRAAATDRLYDLVPSDLQASGRVHAEVTSGDPARCISRTAAEYQADLVVVGVRRSGPARAHQEERTAYKVIRNSHCPVLTIPQPAAVAKRQ
jgi:nucleotide-binding universal stress UspA family protein